MVGIDIDYEQFAFADGRDTWATTRPNWVAFVEELAGALHADGRTLTVSIPPVYDAGQTDSSGFWVYDYGAIVEHVDRIRIMTYDEAMDDLATGRPVLVGTTSVENSEKLSKLLEQTHRPERTYVGGHGGRRLVRLVGTRLGLGLRL